MDFTILHFAIHIVWRANVICTCRKSGIARKTTVAYPELRLKALEDEIMLTLWPMEHSFYFILTDIEHYVEIPESEYPLSVEKAKSYLQNTKQWTDDIQEMMWSLWSDE